MNCDCNLLVPFFCLIKYITLGQSIAQTIKNYYFARLID